MTDKNKLFQEVDKVITQIDSEDTFDLQKVLKPFKGLESEDLNQANARVSNEYYKRCQAREVESKRLLDISQNLFDLMLTSLKSQESQEAGR